MMFSKKEEQILKILGRRKMTIREIAQKIKSNNFDIEIITSNNIRRIARKCEHYKLTWTLTRTRKEGKLYIKREKRR